MNVWFYVGIALSLWVLHDLITGGVWGLEKKVYRKENATEYWILILLWSAVAFGTLYFGYFG